MYFLLMQTVSFAPFAVPVSSVEPTNLSNTSTPDLTELINLVKPGTQNSSQSLKTTNMDVGVSSADAVPGHLSGPTGNHSSVPSVGNLGSQALESGETPLPEVSSIQIETSGSSSILNTGLLTASNGCDGTQPYTVMAIQMPNLSEFKWIFLIIPTMFETFSQSGTISYDPLKIIDSNLSVLLCLFTLYFFIISNFLSNLYKRIIKQSGN